MPELPEVETVRQGLITSLVGQKIAGVEVLRPQSIGFPLPADFAQNLRGHSILDVSRRGKYLLIHLDQEAYLGVHLRMSGRLLVTWPDQPLGSHVRVRIFLEQGQELRFEDMRVFGRLWYVPQGKAVETVITGLQHLGPEPLDNFSGKDLSDRLKRRTQPIKTALLDQSVVAGIGNIYADESLFGAKINPLRPAQSLTLAELDTLTTVIQSTLSRAIVLGGSTLRNYTDSRGVNGNYQEEAWVYARKGAPCRVCGNTVERIRLAGRSTHFCPYCQPLKGVEYSQ
ncbi:MAG: DNA-formamidopyrimidine glycosylase [Gloeobacterales cyanobacterium]